MNQEIVNEVGGNADLQNIKNNQEQVPELFLKKFIETAQENILVINDDTIKAVFEKIGKNVTTCTTPEDFGSKFSFENEAFTSIWSKDTLVDTKPFISFEFFIKEINRILKHEGDFSFSLSGYHHEVEKFLVQAGIYGNERDVSDSYLLEKISDFFRQNGFISEYSEISRAHGKEVMSFTFKKF